MASVLLIATYVARIANAQANPSTITADPDGHIAVEWIIGTLTAIVLAGAMLWLRQMRMDLREQGKQGAAALGLLAKDLKSLVAAVDKKVENLQKTVNDHLLSQAVTTTECMSRIENLERKLEELKEELRREVKESMGCAKSAHRRMDINGLKRAD